MLISRRCIRKKSYIKYLFMHSINIHDVCRGPNTGVPNEVELIAIER